MKKKVKKVERIVESKPEPAVEKKIDRGERNIEGKHGNISRWFTEQEKQHMKIANFEEYIYWFGKL